MKSTRTLSLSLNANASEKEAAELKNAFDGARIEGAHIGRDESVNPGTLVTGWRGSLNMPKTIEPSVKPPVNANVPPAAEREADGLDALIYGFTVPLRLGAFLAVMVGMLIATIFTAGALFWSNSSGLRTAKEDIFEAARWTWQ